MTRKVKLDKLTGLKLSIGCDMKNEVLVPGEYPPTPDLREYIGLDIRDRGQDIIWDIRDGLPLPDDSCSSIWASHVLEHIGADEIEPIMNEMWRVLEAGGTLEIRAPHISSSSAYLPQHKQQFNEHYFYFFTSPNLEDYGVRQWHVDISEKYHRKGDKYDIRVVMHPKKDL